MNALDKVIEALAPQIALRRLKARMMIAHGEKVGFWKQAARSSESRAMSGNSLDHPDSRQNSSERVVCMREARQLEENDGVVRSILRKAGQYAIGRLSYTPQTSNRQINKEIKAYVERWMAVADFSGRHHFRTLARLGISSMSRDGDIGFCIHEDTDPLKDIMKISPVRLQPIEGDRIGLPYAMDYRYWRLRNPTAVGPWNLADGERDFSGVVADRYGRPQRYRIYARHEDDRGLLFDPDMEVPAAQFLHLFDPTRLDAYRGVTAFVAAINDIKDAMEIIGCEKISVKYLSSVSAVVKVKGGAVDADVSADLEHASYNADAERLKAVAPGEIKYLDTDEDMTSLSPDRPSPTFNGFLDTLVRRTGLSVNLPFGFIYSWAGQGTAVRMEAAQADREMQGLQLCIEERVLDPLVKRVISRGIQLGHLPDRLNDMGDWDKGEWRYPAKPTADFGRESAAMIEENLSGQISKTQISADRGEDYEITEGLILDEARRLIERAKILVADSGGEIDMATALFMLEKRTPNAPQATPEKKPVGGPPD